MEEENEGRLDDKDFEDLKCREQVSDADTDLGKNSYIFHQVLGVDLQIISKL